VDKRLFPTCLLLILFASLPTLLITRVSADNVGSDLQVTNLAGETYNFTRSQILAMPKTAVSASLYCYGFLMASGNWSGVRLSYLLQQTGADYANASSIDFLASDGYQMSVPIEAALREDVIVSYEMDGKSLSEGFRLVIPEANGNTWIAMITTISMVDGTGVVPELSSWLIPIALTATALVVLGKKRLFRIH